MKYYCKKCKSEFDPGDVIHRKPDYEAKGCPFCGALQVYGIPDYETPEQYQTRTGNPWPDEGAVWFRPEPPTDFVWGVCRYTTAKQCGDKTIVCIQGPNPPPDDWRP